ncbi:uracil-DNA glycosylase [Ktedonosporobacter rubrisoli]|uniref:Uracil-DNA glycosylase n=1 Tax=Ktedonosporobacter rubrisoli TaxID=2509675 RepID=A0A4P6JSL6_KTERU|nr:uracil-DNA glycosylase family protein [Ktedonosporobacter rubrisoli]QBD78263.1 uracil-DNA glycosylase [Ktedonosporobacter rubrisoli]
MMRNLPKLQPADRENKLIALHQRILSCRLCQERGYIATARPIVQGRANDRIFLIGQAPGHLSVARGVPFSGPGGRVLQKWLERAGFPPGYLHEHVYLSSLTHCDPGKNPKGSGDRRPSPQELALCKPFLEAELNLVQPRVVLLVGTMAIEAFLGKARLEDIIGTYQEIEKRLFLPLPHPSGVSRWLNAPEHQHLLAQALEHLARWRNEYGLQGGQAQPGSN